MSRIWSLLWTLAQIPLIALVASVILLSYATVAAVIIALVRFLVKRSKKGDEQ